MSKKVLVFSHLSELYGANLSLLDVLSELIKKPNISVKVIVKTGGPLIEQLKLLDIPYQIFPFPLNVELGKFEVVASSINWFIKIYRYSRRLKKYYPIYKKLDDIIKDFNPDIIYTNSSVIYWGALWAFFHNKKHVWHLREMKKQYGIKHHFGFKFFISFLKKSQVIICNSYAVANDYKINNFSKTQVIHNGLYNDTQLIEFLNKRKLETSTPLNFCIVGGLDVSKGQLDALTAFNDLKLIYSKDFALHFAGYGSDKDYVEKLQSYVMSHNLSQSVIFWGHVEKMDNFYSKMDVLICCSQHEAFGRILIEAMARGISVIANATGGIPEIITHNYNGWLYEGNNNLITCLLNYYNTSETVISNCRKNAFETVKHNFRKDKYTDKVINCILSN